jgi:hypothetical protein
VNANHFVLRAVTILVILRTPGNFNSQNDNRDADPMRLHPICRNDKWGYMNENGKVVIRPLYDYADDFSGGRAIVVRDRKTFFLRPDGTEVRLPPGVIPASRFYDGLAWVSKDNKFGIIDPDGRLKVRPVFIAHGPFSDGMADASFATSDGISTITILSYIDNNCKIKVFPEYETGGSFSHGIAPAIRRGSHRLVFINKDGAIKFSVFDSVAADGGFVHSWSPAFDGRIVINLDGPPPFRPHGVVLDTSGRRIMTPENDAVRRFSEGLAPIRSGGKWGFIDQEGRLIIGFRFDSVSDFEGGICRAEFGSSVVYIDRDGTELFRATNIEGAPVNDAENFVGSLVRVHIGGRIRRLPHGPPSWEGGRWVYVDKAGKYVALCREDSTTTSAPFGQEKPVIIYR